MGRRMFRVKYFLVLAVLLFGQLAFPAFSEEASFFLLYGDDYLETEEFKKLSTEEKIDRISEASNLLNIYEDFKDKEFFGQFSALYVELEFDIETLRRDIEQSEQYLQSMVQAEIDEPEFFSLYRQSIDWAVMEKKKSAEELYALSQHAGEDCPIEVGHLVKGLRRVYLEMAANKGHKKAHIENDIRIKKDQEFRARRSVPVLRELLKHKDSDDYADALRKLWKSEGLE